nr:MAG TPA: hypothetical protein [Caudoviricetes sp.]
MRRPEPRVIASHRLTAPHPSTGGVKIRIN